MTHQISLLDIFCSISGFRIKLFKIVDHIIGQMTAFLLPPLSTKELPPKVNTILIIRPGGIGDAVFLLPILKLLKNQHFTIDILCEQRNAEVFTSQASLLNAVYLYDQWPFAIFANSYDVVIDTEQWHYLSALTAYFVRSSYKIGFVTRPNRAKLFHKAVAYNIEGYELDNFIKLFEGILIDGGEGSHPLKLEGSLDIDASSQDWAKEQMNSKFVILFLGASIILKRLNEEQVMTIIHHCLEKNYSIALLGGRDVEQFAQGIAVQSNSPKVFNYASKISLMQSGALIQRSSLFIGPDSGLMHMACAIGVPVIGIFGPSNLAKWGPKGAKNKVITENVSCSPCTRFGYTVPTCNGSYHCMKNIKIDRVIHGLNENS